MNYDVVIIGAGLSGLYAAWRIQSSGLSCLLIEQRDRIGGRILSQDQHGAINSDTFEQYDLGPAWVWPGQSHMLQLIHSLGLGDALFDQWSTGDGLYQDAQGQIHRGMNGMSMAGSWRFEGGVARLVSSLHARLQGDCMLLNTKASHIQRDSRHLVIHAETANDVIQIQSRYVVMALPPRLVQSSITFTPALSPQRLNALQATSTWMAGHAKFVFVYKQAFWRQQGLSGDAISHQGPLQEIHDASTCAALKLDAHTEGSGHALFGFVGVAPPHRDAGLRDRAISQLSRLFGEQAEQPQAVLYKDWSCDAATSTPSDQALMTAHELPPMASLSPHSWDGQLVWAGSESASGAPNTNGYLEGAISAAQRSAQTIATLEGGA